MRVIPVTFLLVALFLCAPVNTVHAVAVAGQTYTFSPNPANLDNLDHNCFYSWEINWEKPLHEIITGAALTIENINNWDRGANILYLDLLDTPPKLGTKISDNVTRGTDNEGGGDNFTGPGTTRLTTYTDTNGAPGPAENFSYTLTESQLDILKDYLNDGVFGVGFDPECHFYNSGIQFQIFTSNPPNAPEPATLALCLIGLGAGGFANRKRFLSRKHAL